MSFPLPAPMRIALALADEAGRAGSVPVAALIVRDGTVIASATNAPPGIHDPTAHAEMLVIREAARRLERQRLDDCELWVTLEPCAMCAGAIAHARIARLYYAAEDAKGGAVDNGPRLFGQPTCHHRPEIYGGIGAEQSARMLRAFFADRR